MRQFADYGIREYWETVPLPGGIEPSQSSEVTLRLPNPFQAHNKELEVDVRLLDEADEDGKVLVGGKTLLRWPAIKSAEQC